MTTGDYLPPEFETPAKALEIRKKARRAIRLHRQQFEKAIKLGRCATQQRCRSGLCPICVRDLRKRLLKFLAEQQLSDRRWYLVTIRVKGWTKKIGDYSSFGPLRDHPSIKALLGKLRRRADGNILIVFGSIETVYRVVENVPAGKPFHLHLMISGLKKRVIKEAVKATFDLDSKVAIPLFIDPVGNGENDFVKAASYAFKQPYWKASYRNADDRHSKRQLPKSNQLAELIGNEGAHPWNGRLIILGIRFDQGTFRMT